MSPTRRKQAARHVTNKLGVSVRRACRVIGLSRESLRYKLKRPEMDKPLINDMRRFVAKNPDLGCRKILSLLRTAGWKVNHKRAERLWRQESLGLERKRRKARHKGDEKNSCHVRKATKINQVWSVDFVSDQTEDVIKVAALSGELGLFVMFGGCKSLTHPLSAD